MREPTSRDRWEYRMRQGQARMASRESVPRLPDLRAIAVRQEALDQGTAPEAARRVDLPEGFLDRPMAHRALHGEGLPENSLAAIRAAVAAGYGIEIDVQPSADGVAMAIHDARLERLTEARGPVRDWMAAQLSALTLLGTGERIQTLAEALREIRGRVPLLIELKDQSGGLDGTDGVLEGAVARALAGYAGSVAVMSFNPDMVARMAALLPDLPRGLTTAGFGAGWDLAPETGERLRAVDAADRVGAAFLSHEAADLDRPRVAELKAAGLPILTWTIRSPAEAEAARKVADQITFEGFRPT